MKVTRPESTRSKRLDAAFVRAQSDQAFLDTPLPSRRWRQGRLWPALGVIGLVGVVWQGLSHSGLVAPYLLPTPHKVLNSWLHLADTGTLWKHVGATVQEAVLGFALAFVVSVGLGYYVSRSGLLAQLIAGTQAMPMIALAPVLVMWFGLGLSSKVIICALIVFFPILVNTVVGLKSVDPDMLDAARNQGANGWQTFYHIEVPLSLRTILGGVRMGLTLSLTGAVVRYINLHLF